MRRLLLAGSLVLAICSISRETRATQWVFQAEGTVTRVSTRDHWFHHLRPGNKWSYKIVYDDTGMVNTSQSGSYGQWTFPQGFAATVTAGRLNFNLICNGLIVFNGVLSNSVPVYGLGVNSQLATSGATSNAALDLRSSAQLWNSVAIPNPIPALNVFDLDKTFNFGQTILLPDGSVEVDSFSGYPYSVSLTKVSNGGAVNRTKYGVTNRLYDDAPGISLRLYYQRLSHLFGLKQAVQG